MRSGPRWQIALRPDSIPRAAEGPVHVQEARAEAWQLDRLIQAVDSVQIDPVLVRRAIFVLQLDQLYPVVEETLQATIVQELAVVPA
jgi:hypothetical protein